MILDLVSGFDAYYKPLIFSYIRPKSILTTTTIETLKSSIGKTVFLTEEEAIKHEKTKKQCRGDC